ncbi:MAG: adenylate kinase [Actinomycetota bacterium]
MRLVILGPQGAGKGTQSLRIAEKYDIPSISTGEMFRWAISTETEMGQEAQEYVKRGRLVPNDVTIEVVRERLEADDCEQGFLLDGFPRNLAQAEALDEILADQGFELDAALVIEVPEEVSLRRLTGRRVCSRCGRNYSVGSPPTKDWVCDRCEGKVEARIDDQDEEAIRERLKLYHEQTEPLKEYYESRGKLRTVSGEASPDTVFDQIVEAL